MNALAAGRSPHCMTSFLICWSGGSGDALIPAVFSR